MNRSKKKLWVRVKEDEFVFSGILSVEWNERVCSREFTS